MSVERRSLADRTFDIINYIFMCLALLLTAYPIYYMLIASFSDPNAVYQGRVTLFPADITFDGYKAIFNNDNIWLGYLNSILYTTVGTTLNLLFTIPMAYALSRKELIGRGVIMRLVTFTMYFSGGIIPLYFVVKSLHLIDPPFAMWSLIIPTVISTYNLIVARSFFISSIPEELLEAAFLDGCSYTRFFISIVLPTSQALIAVMVLFYAAGHWNSYFNALIYLNDEKKYPLQLVLRTILIQSEAAAMTEDATTVADKQKLVDLIKYGVIIVSSVPMLVLYPFIQKYFVQGVMIGAVKG